MADALKEVKPVKLSPKDHALVMRKIIEACRREGYYVIRKENAQKFLETWLYANLSGGIRLTLLQCKRLALDALEKLEAV